MQRLTGKVALITGAGTGIGEAIAKKFSREGALVALVGKPDDPVEAVAAEIIATGGEAVAYKGDAGEMAFAEAAVAGAVARYGRLDVLVANAGSLVTTGMTEQYPVDAFEQMLHDNCRTVFHCVRAALPELQKTRGCIVAAGSEAGFNGTPQFTAYGATKGWVHSFIKGVAVEQAQVRRARQLRLPRRHRLVVDARGPRADGQSDGEAHRRRHPARAAGHDRGDGQRLRFPRLRRSLVRDGRALARRRRHHARARDAGR